MVIERKCFVFQVKKERLQDYLKAHVVWPELVEEMQKHGLRNYSLFYRSDGMLVGYVEGENIMDSLHALSQTEVSKRWEEYMGQFFEDGPIGNEDTEWLEQYFYSS